MTSALPPYAPTGIPPPIILPYVIRSGCILKYPLAPVSPNLKPVITSSKIRSALLSSHSFLRPLRKPSLGSTTPILADTGSTITQAISSLFSSKSFLTLSKSLYTAVRVSLTQLAGTPLLSGIPAVITPLPAFTRSASE